MRKQIGPLKLKRIPFLLFFTGTFSLPLLAEANFHCSVRSHNYTGRHRQDENLTTPFVVRVDITITVEDNKKAAECRAMIGQGPLRFTGARTIPQGDPDLKKGTEQLVTTVPLLGTGPLAEDCTAIVKKAYGGTVSVTCPPRTGRKGGTVSCSGPLDD